MGKGYKRKTRWRTLNIGAPPGEEDEEDGIRNGYVKGQENGTNSRNGQTGHKTGRTDSTGSTTSDYASDYASAASRSRRDDSVGSPAQPKIIFNENEYTRITTPRQDVLFKKGYLSRKKIWASTASTSATPSTTESQSASHSTADGSETTEDQRLLDYKGNGAEEYQAMMEPGAQVAYGTFYDHVSGYYYEYPVMVVGPGPGMPGGPPMHNVLTAMPCGPVPLRPIEWVNPAFVPKIGNEQYCVMDYQTAQLSEYPMLVDENGLPLKTPTENGISSEEAYHENETENASWTGSVAGEENPGNNVEQNMVNGTEETSAVEVEEIAETSVNSELYMETALAQQLQMTHVAIPPIPEPYVYPGYYMFGPSLINVNGVTIQSGPMVRNAGITGGPTNAGACAKRRKKKKLSRRKSRGPLRLGNPEADAQEEEEEYSSEAETAAGLAQLGIVNEAGTAGIGKVDQAAEDSIVTTSHGRPLNPECQEFRPIQESRIVSTSNDTNFCSETIVTSSTSVEISSSVESTEKEERIAALPKTNEKSIPPASLIDDIDQPETINTRIIVETMIKSLPTDVKTIENLVSRQSEEIEAVPVDFAAEVFANVSIMAERALAPRSVVEGTPMETEIGLDATSVNFQEIVENHEIGANDSSAQDPQADSIRNRLTADENVEDKDIVPNGVDKEEPSPCERTCANEQAPEPLAEASLTTSEARQRPSAMNEKRGSRSASPGMINRTTTPINANSHRLPESYESLVTRGISFASSLPTVNTVGTGQQARNRKYSSKGPKFVREATPGPDLDVAQAQNTCVNSIDVKMRNNKAENGNNVDRESTMRISRTSVMADDEDDNGAITTGIEALESELQRYSITTDGSTSNGCEKRSNRADPSNDDSGVESQTRMSSEHPITDAVTEWLERANSPELFVTSTMMSESEPEDDELENEEPPKNLQGNPMPALSANSSGVNDSELSRLASFGKFAINENTMGVNVSDESTIERKMRKNNVTNGMPRRKRRGNASRREMRMNNFCKVASNLHTNEEKTVNVDINTNNSVEAARLRLVESSSSSSEIENRTNLNEVCEFTENDSVAGMRVAKSSRTKNNMALMKMMMDSCESREIAEKMRRSGMKGRAKKTIVASNRDVPIENVEVKVRRMGIDENDEGIVEDEEVSVRTFEKGQIVVSIEGKVLPVDSYEPVLLQKNAQLDERPKFSMITCEKSRTSEIIGDETSPSECASKRNSLGSIEEPDVLECWEVETVEPVTTPKRVQARGESLEGEAAEDELDRKNEIVDPAGVEIVRKYYRLEAMRDSGTSVTSIDDYCTNENIDESHMKMLKSPDRMIESICSEDIPVVGERMSKIVESMLDRSGIPIDEALEVYESCYGGKPTPSYLAGLEAKFRNTGSLYGQDLEREGAVPCKAACCNIQ